MAKLSVVELIERLEQEVVTIDVAAQAMGVGVQGLEGIIDREGDPRGEGLVVYKVFGRKVLEKDAVESAAEANREYIAQKQAEKEERQKQAALRSEARRAKALQSRIVFDTAKSVVGEFTFTAENFATFDTAMLQAYMAVNHDIEDEVAMGMKKGEIVEYLTPLFAEEG